MCQKDSSNLTHTVCFDVLIYRPIGELDVTNERMTHLLKLDTFFHTHHARVMTHDTSRIRTTHRVNLALYFKDMFLNGISLDFCKKPRNVHFDLILFFHFLIKLVLPTYGPFSWSASHILFFF